MSDIRKKIDEIIYGIPSDEMVDKLEALIKQEQLELFERLEKKQKRMGVFLEQGNISGNILQAVPLSAIQQEKDKLK